jgi:O-antigen ligase
VSNPPASGGSDGGPPSGREDPWERRERIRERQRQGAARRSRGSTAAAGRDDFGPVPPDEAGFPNNVNVLGLIAGVGILLLTEVPQFGGSLRQMVEVIGAAILLLLIAGTRRWRSVPGGILGVLRRAPNLPLLLLVAWAAFEFIRAPYRGHAAMEALRVAAGAGAYLLAAYSLRTSRQTAYVVTGLLGIGVAISIWDLVRAGQAGAASRGAIGTHYSLLGTHEDVGSLLVLLLPIALSLALSTAVEEKRRLAATAAAIILGAALLVARTRSAWLGGLAALVVLAALSLRVSLAEIGGSREERGRRGKLDWKTALTSPVTLLALGMLAFVLIGGALPLLQERAMTLRDITGDQSFAGRLASWGGAALMVQERPVVGWGLGVFPVIQGFWTHRGEEVQTVLGGHQDHLSIAHNFYLQWAADTGLVGLTLHVVTCISFLLASAWVLPRVTAPFARALLLGCTAAVAGAMVDALGSPAYNFHGVSTVFWACMGLGVAAAGLGLREGGSGEKGSIVGTTPWWVWAGSGVMGGLAAATVFGGGLYLTRMGQRVPRGTLEVSLSPAGRITPGQKVQWTARFRDEKGQEQSTMPGTVWQLSGDPALSRMRVVMSGEAAEVHAPVRSVLSAVAPGARTPLYIRATYRDRYGRWHDAWSILTVAVPAAAKSATGRRE